MTGAVRTKPSGWTLTVVAMLFPFGFASMRAIDAQSPWRWTWRIAITAGATACEVAVWLTLDPRVDPARAGEFMLAQAAMLCIAVQLAQGPAIARALRGAWPARCAWGATTLAIAWTSAQPMIRANDEIHRQATIAGLSETNRSMQTDRDRTGSETDVSEMTRLMAMGYDHPRAVESSRGRAEMTKALDGCGLGDAAACETARTMTGDTVEGTMSRPWAITAWLLDPRRRTTMERTR